MKKTVLLLFVACVSVRAQDRVTVPFSSATEPRKLVLNTPMGSINVRAYEGNEVVIESTGLTGVSRRSRKEPPPGMHRIGPVETPRISEQNNVVKVESGMFNSNSKLTIQVPAQTSVNVKTMSGEIHIENIGGEIEASSLNGKVEIVNASGSVMAHSMNGKVTVSLASFMPDKAMSFSTFNGDVDVTLPSSIKANVKMKTNRGSMFTDFDFQLSQSGSSSARGRGDHSTAGTINGGGPEIQFTTYNGDIFLHKKQ